MCARWRLSRLERGWLVSCALAAAFAALPQTRAGARDPFPELRPSTRAQAAAQVAGQRPTPLGCLNGPLHEVTVGVDGSLSLRRALGLLHRRDAAGTELLRLAPHDVRVRYAGAGSAQDAIASADGDGQPDLLAAVLAGMDEARGLLVERLQLTAPEALEVLLVELGDEPEGYFLPAAVRPAPGTIVLDATPKNGPAGLRRAAAHQYAHAVAALAGPAMPADWAEALATWTTLTLDTTPDLSTTALLSDRLARMDAGLVTSDYSLAAGNSIWLAFLEQAYGMPAVRITMEELARGQPPLEALERAVRRAAGENLASAFREFHLWAVLVGQRSDRQHFAFADRLASPRFASTAEGLPALAVLTDPPVAPWGATQIRLRPESREGGLRIHFEGEFPAQWQVDLILVDASGTLRRLPLAVSAEGRAETTVPLHRLAEAWLLVRNLGTDDGTSRRYTYAAHRERGFPFELASIEAAAAGQDGTGVLISWETSSERQLVGFNVVREREESESGQPIAINPVWIPAVGDAGNSTWYHFLDPTPEPGASYLYRIEGITTEGLTSLSDPVIFREPSPR